MVLLLPMLLDQVLSKYVSSPSPDLSVFGLGMLLAWHFLDVLEPRRSGAQGTETPQGRAKEDDFTLFSLVLLGSVGVTVKLSLLVPAALTCFIAIAVWWRRRPLGARLRILCVLLATGLLTQGVWMGRGIVLSGYPLFPSSVAGAPVEWRVPPQVGENLAAIIRAYHRDWNPDMAATLSNWQWLSGWLAKQASRGQRFHALVPLTFALLCLAASVWGWLRRGKERRPALWQGLFLFPHLGGLLFWFYMGPSTRYAGASFWILAAGAYIFTLLNFGRFKRGLLLLFIVLSCACLSPRYRPYLVGPGPNLGFHPKPRNERAILITRSGLVVHTGGEKSFYWSRSGWQARAQPMLYDQPLPSSLWPDAALRLRRPGDMSGGFVLDER